MNQEIDGFTQRRGLSKLLFSFEAKSIKIVEDVSRPRIFECICFMLGKVTMHSTCMTERTYRIAMPKY